MNSERAPALTSASKLASEAIVPRTRTKIEGIQALRFIAAAMVLLTHETFYIHERVSSAFRIWTPGSSGVPIFFVISGIVMILASAKLSNNIVGSCTFLSARISRIVPLYWLLTTFKVILAIAIPSAILHNHFDWAHALKSYFFIPAFNQDGEIRPIHGVGWTLLHEMYFYLLYAISMALRANPLWTVGIFICGVYTLGLFVAFDSAFMLVATSHENLHFVIGMALGVLLLRNRYTIHQAAGICIATWAVLLSAKFAHIPLIVDPIAATAAGAVPLFVRASVRGGMNFFARLGESSYSLYLIHPIVASGLVTIFGKLQISLILNLLLSFLITVAIAHAVHLFIENPLVYRTKKRLDLLVDKIRAQA
jgi:peptidoglycan/LPS O-acetylase OafA/YrhL